MLRRSFRFPYITTSAFAVSTLLSCRLTNNIICSSTSSISIRSSFHHVTSILLVPTPRQHQQQSIQAKHVKTATQKEVENSPLVRCVHTAVFKLCTGGKSPVFMTPAEKLKLEETSATNNNFSPANPRSVSLAQVMKQIPDEILEEELEKFSNGGVREIIGKYLTEFCNLKYDAETKTWWVKHIPVKEDLVALNEFVEAMLKNWNKPTPLQNGDVGEYLRHDPKKCSNSIVSTGPKLAANPETARYANMQVIRELGNRIVADHKGVLTALWRASKLPTCRWEIVDGRKSNTIELFLTRDEFGRVVNKVQSGTLTADQLIHYVPTFFVPIDQVVTLLKPVGYSEQHIRDFFSFSRNVQIVTLPLTKSTFIRISTHVAPDIGHLSGAIHSERRFSSKYQPRPELAGKYIQILQNYFVEQNQLRRTQQQQHEKDDGGVSFVPQIPWMPLRQLLEQGGKELESTLPFQGPEALLYFSQMQHIFCFTPEPNGGMVCLNSFMYDFDAVLAQDENTVMDNNNNNNSQKKLENLLSQGESLHDKFRSIVSENNPNVYLAHPLPEDYLPQNQQRYRYVTPLLQLKGETTPLVFVTAEFVVRLKRDFCTSVTEVKSRYSRIHSIHGNVNTFENRLKEMFQPIWDFAPRRNIVPPEDFENAGFVQNVRNLRTSSEQLLKREREPNFRDNLLLYIRFHSFHFTYDYESDEMTTIKAAFRRHRTLYTLEERLQRALRTGENNPKKLHNLRLGMLKVRDPSNPLWNQENVAIEFAKYLPVDCFVTGFELFGTLLPQHLYDFIPARNIERWCYRNPNHFIVFDMKPSPLLKQGHIHSLPRSLFGNQNYVRCYKRPEVPFPPEDEMFPLEATSEQVAEQIVEMMLKCGGRSNIAVANSVSRSGSVGALNVESLNSQYAMTLLQIAENMPLMRIKDNYLHKKIYQWVPFMQQHPDKFILIGSGQEVDCVMLNPTYLHNRVHGKNDDEEDEDEDQ